MKNITESERTRCRNVGSTLGHRHNSISAAASTSALRIAQSLQTINMAIPAKSFQMVIYPVAQQKGYMKEEGLDQRVIFVAPTTSIQAMLGGDVQFTGAGTARWSASRAAIRR